MKEHQILFKPVLSEANQANFNNDKIQLKTQTRRITGLDRVNNYPDFWEFMELGYNEEKQRVTAKFKHRIEANEIELNCPYGKPGDLLWVRENWKATEMPFGAKWWIDYQSGHKFDTELLYTDPNKEKAAESKILSNHWNPSIHMPKLAASQWLMVRELRLERLQDISSHDAIREGIECSTETPLKTYKDYDLSDDFIDIFFQSPFNSFTTLISKIHTPEILEINPWVWVIDYYPISTTGKPDEDTIAMWEDFRINIGEEWNKNSLAAICTRLKNTSNSALEAAKLQTV